MRRIRTLTSLAFPSIAAAVVLAAPGAAAAQATPAARPDTLTGYPIASDAVVSACSSCHARDAAGRLGRISFLRKTPEGWQESIRRMVSLNGVRLSPEAAREVVRYLADRQGIAPDELRPARWEVERSLADFDYKADDDAERVCSSCHSLGRVMTQRRTKQEWELLAATHRGYYPLIDRQVFYDRGPNRRGPHPVEKATTHFAEAFPLETPAWSAWSANLRAPRLEGTWALSGHDPAHGPLYGTVTISSAPGTPDEFSTEAAWIHPEDGTRVARGGRAIVYTGYQWRGRSSAASGGAELREVMMVERTQDEMSGRWFTGANDELGIEVTLRKSLGTPIVTGVHPRAVRRGRTVEVRVFGDRLPTVGAGDPDFGPGVRVAQIVRAEPQEWVVRLEVAADATPGARDLVVRGAVAPGALIVHDGVDRIAITPGAGLARVGGENFPKQLQRFEAMGFADGPDGKPETADDLPLGRVPATWSIEEYPVTYDDDDAKFVGTIDATGLFTPAVDGPNPQRSGNRNNIGDVWVTATHTPEGADARPVRARAHLVVTVPLYMRWDPWPLPGTRPTIEDANASRGLGR
jgi:quinohemoprotein amine dehydrogenase